MKAIDVFLLVTLGLAIWVIGTVYYAYHGLRILETTSSRYWIAFFTSPIYSAVMCQAILWWRHIPRAQWASAMLLLALPGMIGEALVLTHLGVFMPALPETSGGKYGALLFATYGVVLGMAQIVTLMAK